MFMACDKRHASKRHVCGKWAGIWWVYRPTHHSLRMKVSSGILVTHPTVLLRSPGGGTVRYVTVTSL